MLGQKGGVTVASFTPIIQKENIDDKLNVVENSLDELNDCNIS